MYYEKNPANSLYQFVNEKYRSGDRLIDNDLVAQAKPSKLSIGNVESINQAIPNNIVEEASLTKTGQIISASSLSMGLTTNSNEFFSKIQSFFQKPLGDVRIFNNAFSERLID
jgi:hypothetical protein